MRIAAAALALSFALCAAASGQDIRISGEKIRAHVKYLSSDELEGRGVGTRGEKLATDYIAAQLQTEGVKPGGDNGTYFQRVPLVGCTTALGATLHVSGKGQNLNFAFAKDFVGTSFAQEPRSRFNAEAVFVGHGISAPEVGWDDYKGVHV